MRYPEINFRSRIRGSYGPGFPLENYDWYVNGNLMASGNGRSLNGGWKTIAEGLAAASPGASIWVERLYDGSAYRADLIIPGNGIRIYSSGIYVHSDTGGTWSGGARIRGGEIAANADFTKTIGQTNVYEITVTVEVGANNRINILENGFFLTLAASVAACDSTPGSFYVGSHSGTVTVYVHASDSSDVTTNGKEYEYPKRIYAIANLSYSGVVIQGLSGEFCLSDSSPLAARQATVSHCRAQLGGKHTIQVNPTEGSITDCLVEDGYYTSGTLFNYNDNVFAGETYEIKRITIKHNSASSPGWLTNALLNGHQNISGTLGVLNMTDVVFLTASVGISGGNHTDVINLLGCHFIEVVSGVTNSSISQIVNVTGGSYVSSYPNTQKFMNIAYTGTVNLSGVTVHLGAASALGLISITAAATVTVDSCDFRSDVTTSTRIAVYCTSAGANLTLTNNTYNGTGNGWTYHYYFTAGASGMTWTSDYNAFESTTDAWFIFGNTYSDLASYQAATSQDAHSTST